MGPDVILVHRLPKNDVVELTGIQAHALLTEPSVGSANHCDDGSKARVEHMLDWHPLRQPHDPGGVALAHSKGCCRMNRTC